MKTGIVGDKIDIQRRKRVFGKNRIVLPKITSFTDLVAQQFEDQSVKFLVVAATVYLLLSLIDGSRAYIESLTIYVGVYFAALVAAFSDYIKEKQFLGLKDQINKETVLVYRG